MQRREERRRVMKRSRAILAFVKENAWSDPNKHRGFREKVQARRELRKRSKDSAPTGSG